MPPLTSRDVRPAYLAGTWYPRTKQELEATVDAYLGEAAQPPLPGRVIGLMAPHAGYAYSGKIAAHAYAQARGAPYSTVVLIGLAHRVSIGPYGIAGFRCLSTPLGQIEVDEELADKLGRRVRLNRVASDNQENSLEVQLPFLQRVLGRFKVLPIMMGFSLAPYAGDAGWEICQELGKALAEAIAGRDDVLLVASSDLSHLDDYREVERCDKVFNGLLEAFDAERLAKALVAEECNACGGAAVVTVMLAAKAQGADKATVLAYAHSGQTTGQLIVGQYTVGYTAAAFTRSLKS